MNASGERRRSIGSEDWIEMEVHGVLLDPTSSAPVLILRSVGGQLILPIWIGLAEASSIAIALEKVPPARPLTHDLLARCIEQLGARALEIRIVSLDAGTFHASLLLRRDQKTFEMDARPSDAIALAVRTSAPIRVAREVLEEALLTGLGADEVDEDGLRSWLEQARPEDLGKYEM